MSDKLWDELEFAKRSEIWTSIVLDALQFVLTTISIVYLAVKGRYRQLSWKIVT